MATQFHLLTTILQLSPNDRQHNPLPRMVAFFEAIIQGGVSIPLHPFLVEVLDYFNLVPFQFTPNSIGTMVAFYIAFMEVDIGEPFVVEFTYIYCIKALTKN